MILPHRNADRARNARRCRLPAHVAARAVPDLPVGIVPPANDVGVGAHEAGVVALGPGREALRAHASGHLVARHAAAARVDDDEQADKSNKGAHCRPDCCIHARLLPIFGSPENGARPRSVGAWGDVPRVNAYWLLPEADCQGWCVSTPIPSPRIS